MAEMAVPGGRLWTRRGVARVALGLLGVGLGLLPGVAAADRWATDARDPQVWVTTTSDASLRAEANINSERLALVRPGTRLRVLGDQGDWVHVYDPRRDTTAYVYGALVAPTDPPGPFAYMPGPPPDDELDTTAIVTDDMTLSYYPTADPRAEAIPINASDRETVVGSVVADDGATWYVTDDGYYLPSDGVFLGSDPQDFGGRWIEVTLSGAAHGVAYEGGEPVRSFPVVKGTIKFPTQPGAWSIVRRVADETMDSATVGIPRNAPNGYYLQHVLYTQYFTGDGASLHYNWWAGAYGQAGSHGCLGLNLADSRWLWDWASIGTPVLIHP
jgi:L,D-transpeptidase catalytic domain/Bacterial SH3 domain